MRGVDHQQAETDRRMLWLAEGHRVAAQAQTSRTLQGRLDLYLRVSGIQPGEDAQTDTNSDRGLMGP